MSELETIKLKLPLKLKEFYPLNEAVEKSSTVSETGYHYILEISRLIGEDEPFVEVEIPVAKGDLSTSEIEGYFYFEMGKDVWYRGDSHRVIQRYAGFIEHLLLGEL